MTALAMPLFAVEPAEWEVPDPALFDALLLTSANAVRHGGAGLQRLKGLVAHCVGEATANAARLSGLIVGQVGSGGVGQLLSSLPAGLRLLHLAGADRRPSDTDRHAITALTVYRSVELPPPQRPERFEGSVIAVHSPRAAARIREVAEAAGLDRARIAIAAISAEAAAAAGDGWERVEAASEPSDSALLALAARLCDKD
jgi:uroporphyrinogen-III synthase